MAPRLRRNRRDEILAATAALMAEGIPLQAITMEKVAKAAGIGKATLYRHFPGREALVQALVEEGLAGPLPAAKDRREAILQGALGAFTSHGLAETTMDVVAREAGVSLASLYRHFRSKEHLVEALLARFSVLGDVTRLADPEFSGDDRQALEALALRLLQVATERAPLIRLVVASAATHPEAAEEAFRQGPGRIIRLLAAYVENRARSGAFRPGDALIRAQAFVSACVMFGLALSIPGAVVPVPLETVAREYADLFLFGLRKGE